MSRAREYLRAELGRKLRRYRVVVWDDRDHRYTDLAAGVIPQEAAFAAYDGSWFALRREVEPLLSQADPGPLVIYVPAPRPDQDPLEEARQAGTSWSITLETLLSKALAGELTPARIAALARRARTLTEAETAIEGGSVDARLISAFRSADVVEIAVDVLSAERDAAVAGEDAWKHVAETLSTHLGGELPSEPEALRSALFRHLALAVLADALSGLPDSLAAAAAPVTTQQFDRCRRVLERLRDPGLIEVHRRLGERFDAEIQPTVRLPWADALAGVDVSPATEQLALSEALHRLEDGDVAGARWLAERRLESSRWAQPRWSPGEALTPSHPYRQWDAVQRVALLSELTERRQPPKGDPGTILTWYGKGGWEVDRAHRLMELARADLGHAGGLDEHIRRARAAYEAWLGEVATATSAAVAERGLDVAPLSRQGHVFADVVEAGGGPTAYVLVDALRFELGMALAQRLGGPGGGQPACQPAVAAVPTITPVGMANLLPGAEDGLSLTLGDTASLVVSVAGRAVATPEQRIDLLRREVGTLVDLTLGAMMSRSDDALREEIAKADLVVVRTTAIDAAGEGGHAGGAWRAVDGALDDLATQIHRLGRLGIARVVVTADHGFIVLSEALSSGHVLARPSGTGELHRRCWVGRAGVTPDGARRLALADLGMAGGLDLIVPAGLSVFPLPGTRQFFHGGLSPQELVIPVLVVSVAPGPAAEPTPDVSIAVAGKGITTGVFAATLSFAGSLFRSEVSVRVLARTAKGPAQAARLVAGDGYDPASGTVAVGFEPAVLTFQVTASLERSTPVELHVLDAASGVELARAKVPVVTPVAVEEGWL